LTLSHDAAPDARDAKIQKRGTASLAQHPISCLARTHHPATKTGWVLRYPDSTVNPKKETPKQKKEAKPSKKSTSTRASTKKDSHGIKADATTKTSLAKMRGKLQGGKTHSQLLLETMMPRPSATLIRLRASVSPSSNMGQNPPVRKRIHWRFERREQTTGLLGHCDDELEAVVAYLLTNGADPNVCDADGNCPLLLCVQFSNSHRLTRTLLLAGADASALIEQGENEACTVLDVAMHLGQQEQVRVLLEHGALPAGDAEFLTEEDARHSAPTGAALFTRHICDCSVTSLAQTLTQTYMHRDSACSEVPKAPVVVGLLRSPLVFTPRERCHDSRSVAGGSCE
jgi:hypothetical protein